MPYIGQVAIGKKPNLTIFGSDYDTPDGTGEFKVWLKELHFIVFKVFSKGCLVLFYSQSWTSK